MKHTYTRGATEQGIGDEVLSHEDSRGFSGDERIGHTGGNLEVKLHLIHCRTGGKLQQPTHLEFIVLKTFYEGLNPMSTSTQPDTPGIFSGDNRTDYTCMNLEVKLYIIHCRTGGKV